MPGLLEVALVSAYLLGSIPFPLIVTRLVRGVDLRTYGTGNMGARNASRLLGKGWSAVILLLDAAKGAGAAWLGDALAGEPLWAGMAAAVGHIWPLFAQFRGGKGLAASLGALLWTSLPLTAVTAAAILPFWGMSRSLYMGVSAAALLLPLSCWWQFRSLSAVAAGAAWGGVVLWAHRRDIRDYLQARRERRAG